MLYLQISPFRVILKNLKISASLSHWICNILDLKAEPPAGHQNCLLWVQTATASVITDAPEGNGHCAEVKLPSSKSSQVPFITDKVS